MIFSPQGSTTAMHFSSGSLARASRSSSTSRTVLLGSWWECGNMTASPPSLNHFTGSPSHSGVISRSPSSPISVYMATPHPTSRNSSPLRSLSGQTQPASSNPQGGISKPWGGGRSVRLHPGCGTTSPKSSENHRQLTPSNKISKPTCLLSTTAQINHLFHLSLVLNGYRLRTEITDYEYGLRTLIF